MQKTSLDTTYQKTGYGESLNVPSTTLHCRVGFPMKPADDEIPYCDVSRQSVLIRRISLAKTELPSPRPQMLQTPISPVSVYRSGSLKRRKRAEPNTKHLSHESFIVAPKGFVIEALCPKSALQDRPHITKVHAKSRKNLTGLSEFILLRAFLEGPPKPHSVANKQNGATAAQNHEKDKKEKR